MGLNYYFFPLVDRQQPDPQHDSVHLLLVLWTGERDLPDDHQGSYEGCSHHQP